MNPRNFFAELKRRNVYKVAVAYAIVGWLLHPDRDHDVSGSPNSRPGRCGSSLFSCCSVSRSRSFSPGPTK